ncbi:MAG: hypothetical protein Q4E55_04580 [Bacteroidales bacterium]|nr:hypothetical protein [Bacteroidales bacterium]
MKQDKYYIERLLGKFLEGQTSKAEEQILSEYFCAADDIPMEWQAYKVMFQSFKTDAYDFSDDEIDVMLTPVPERKARAIRLWLWASVACTAAIVTLFIWHSFGKEITSESSPIAEVKTIVEVPVKDNIENPIKEKVIAEAVHSPKQTKASKAKSTKKGTKKAEEITTSEIVEAINLLADLVSDDITITATPNNEGFLVKASYTDGESTSYQLHRGSDGSSLEMTSNYINF